MKNITVKFLASSGGAGYMPFASGTWGSLVAALIYWFFFPASNIVNLLITLAVTVAAVPISTVAEALYGKKDDGHIVIDEVIGMWLSVLFLPRTLGVFVAAFFLFRALDVIKPFFIRKVQNLKGGLGIVADDFLAGIAANLILQAALFVGRSIF